MHVRRVVWSIGIAVAVFGCSSPATETVVGCPAGVIEGALVAQEHGTAIQAGPNLTPIIWPRGYTFQHSGGPWDIRNERGNTIARTGELVRLSGGFITGDDHWTTCGPPLDVR